MTTPTSANSGFSLRSVLPMLFFDGLCPYLNYVLLTARFPGLSEVTVLAIGAIFPAAYGIFEIAHRGRIDIMGSVVLVGIAVSIAATFVGGDPKMLLIRESFVTGALGVVCLSSLLWPRPLMFYVGRQFTAHDKAQIKEFNASWQYPAARRLFGVLTIVWGLGWVIEFVLRVVMVWTLSIEQVLAISPFVFNGIFLALITWNIAYVNRAQARAHAQQPPDETPAAMNEKQVQPMKDQQQDSEAIRRAVYDGMQDLRVKKSR